MRLLPAKPRITADGARRWLVLSSLVLVALHAAFLVLAPGLGYPLRYPQAFRLLESITPIFFSFLAAAATFIVGGAGPAAKIQIPVNNAALFTILLHGPIYVLGGINAIGFLAFGITNRIGAPTESGMRADDLARLLTITMSLLMATSSALVGWLFNVKNLAPGAPPAPDTTSASGTAPNPNAGADPT